MAVAPIPLPPFTTTVPGHGQYLPPAAPPGTPAPYPVNTLQPPLTLAQRTAIEAWLIMKGYGSALGSQVPFDDTTLIADYNAVLSGGGFGNAPTPKVLNPSLTSWEDALTNALNDLTSGAFWLRVAEFLAGAILLGVGINAALRQGMGKGAPQIPGPKKIAKTVVKATPAGKTASTATKIAKTSTAGMGTSKPEYAPRHAKTYSGRHRA